MFWDPVGHVRFSSLGGTPRSPDPRRSSIPLQLVIWFYYIFIFFVYHYLSYCKYSSGFGANCFVTLNSGLVSVYGVWLPRGSRRFPCVDRTDTISQCRGSAGGIAGTCGSGDIHHGIRLLGAGCHTDPPCWNQANSPGSGSGGNDSVWSFKGQCAAWFVFSSYHPDLSEEELWLETS